MKPDPHPSSMPVGETTPEAVPHLLYPVIDSRLPTVDRGASAFLYDSEGREYLDGSSGAVTANLGHGVPDVIEAMIEQARRVAFVFRSHFTSEPAEELAQLLAELAPGDLDWVFFVNSGSEGTELAQKIAIQYWQERGRPSKRRVLSRRTSYHGMTLGALSMSGHAGRRRRFEELLTDDAVVAPPYRYRCPHCRNAPSCDLACADTLSEALERIGPENVAAFIAEPVVGASGGAIVPPAGYDTRIRRICDEYDILYIADEVMTGLGRAGHAFASAREGATPDMIVLGKGLGAGYAPIGAVLLSDAIVQAVKEGSGALLYGHTMSANPLSTATALAVVRHILREGLIERAAVKGRELGERLRELACRHPVIGDVRGSGMMWGLELVADAEGTPFPAERGVTSRLVSLAFENGLIVYPAAGALGDRGDAVLVAPPLNSSDAVLERLIELLDRALGGLERELRGEA